MWGNRGATAAAVAARVKFANSQVVGEVVFLLDVNVEAVRDLV